MESKMEDHGGFQAAYLHTDSVSFGRFEAESLSWEKRSSFSHNRYLEEVEKCSTPGSVTQKKALLEAHFKKKGMLHQNSSHGKNDMEGQMDKVCEDKVDESEDLHINGLQFQEFQNRRKDSVQFSWYDETPVISDDPEDCVTDGECEVTSVSKNPAGAAFEVALLEANNQQVEHEIAYCQVHSDLASAQEDIQGSEEKEFSSETKIIHGPAEAKDRSAAKAPRYADHVPLKKIQKSSAKVYGKTSLEQKMIKTNTRSQSIATQKQEKPSSDNKHIRASKAPAKTPKKGERDGPRVTTSDEHKHMHLRPSPSPATRIVKSNATTKDSETVKGSKRGDDKSMEKCEKSLRANRSGLTANSTSANSEAVSRQYASRRTSGMNAIKREPKTTGAVFTFKSDERAERRKEYNMKLEEKLLAKEAKMNEIQAKSQEERETAMKQFRRSLTFKAIPMPSFYQNEADQSASGGKKVITSYPTAPRERSSSRNTWVKVMENNVQSQDTPNSTNPEVKTNSEPGPEKMEVPSEGSGDEGVAGNAKVSSQKIEGDKKDTKGKLHQQGESSNKVKKGDKSSKLKTSSSQKVTKGMIGGSTVVRVA